MHRFEGKVAIITGAGSGIGKATALQLAKEGAVVICTSRDKKARDTVDLILSLGGDATYRQVDVTVSQQIKDAVEETVRTYGQIDCVYNNAAMTGPVSSIEDYDEEIFREVFATNVYGQFYMMKHVIPHLKAGASIVNCSSLHGTRGMEKASPYSASKHAVIGLTRSAAIELGPKGIRANAICPGPIGPTRMLVDYEEQLGASLDVVEEMIAAGAVLKRFGKEEEVAQHVCFLLSPQASYITGAVHLCDGGYSANG